MNDVCQFCELRNQGYSRHFAYVMGTNTFDEVLYASRDFIVIPDVAPCAIGHILIVAREHCRSLNEEWKRQDLLEITAIVESCVGEKSGLIIFEHGIVTETAKPSCVEHAHVHLIPHSGSIVPALLGEVGGLTPIAEPAALQLSGETVEYALVRDTDRQWYQTEAMEIPGQAIRRSVMGLGIETHWNWLDYVQFADQLNTRQRIVRGSSLFELVRSSLHAHSPNC